MENMENTKTTGIPNVDREVNGLPPVPEKMFSTMVISMDEYRELLTYKGKYEELKDICNNKLTSPILNQQQGSTIPFHTPGIRTPYVPQHGEKSIEEQNENHIPGV